MVDKAQAEIEFLNMELQVQIRITGNKHVDTALARYNLGRALWLSNKPLETTQAVDEFQAAILFMKQREPNQHSLISFERARDTALESAAFFRTPGTLSAWPYWKPPTARWEDKREMTELFRELLAMTGRENEATVTASTVQHGLRRHGLHDFSSPRPQLVNRTTLTEMACDEIEKMKMKIYKTEATSPRPISSTTKPQLCPSSAGGDTQCPQTDPPTPKGSNASPGVKGERGRVEDKNIHMGTPHL